VKAFLIVLTGNMLQVADNSRFIRYNTKQGCRVCLVLQTKRKDIKYNVVKYRRYYFNTILLRKEGIRIDLNRARAIFFKDLRIREEPPTIIRIALTLDLILGRRYNALHLE
jgi:hypothetical protein